MRLKTSTFFSFNKSPSWWKCASNWGNVRCWTLKTQNFNISRDMLKMLKKVSGENFSEAAQTFPRNFNIFNISGEMLEFWFFIPMASEASVITLARRGLKYKATGHTLRLKERRRHSRESKILGFQGSTSLTIPQVKHIFIKMGLKLKKCWSFLFLSLVAFHPRPQIASDLGRNVTRNFNPHRNRNQFPSGNEILACGRRLKSQPASTRCDLRIASPTRPFLQVIWAPQIANPQAAIAELGPPGGRKSQNRRPEGH